MNTNNQNIEELVAKYLEGETSLAEEKILMELLRGEEVPEKFRELIPIAIFANEERMTRPYRENLESKTFRRIKRRNLLRLDTRNGRLAWKISSVAASFIIAFTAFILMREPASDSGLSELSFESNIKDPKQAYIETRKAFSKISINLGLAQKEMDKLEIIDRNIGKLDEVSKFDEYRKLIFK